MVEFTAEVSLWSLRRAAVRISVHGSQGSEPKKVNIADLCVACVTFVSVLYNV